MCLVTFRIAPNEDLSLVLVGNRDELHNRPTDPLHWWAEPEILAGLDLEAGRHVVGREPFWPIWRTH